ncbi:hypothetical protein [Nocardia altamirensis]|uniref:hypothetical protein n=1 Tax=Nocardia altamirensis TaxID=472158 RepID=UPI00114C9D86|nr:hypothetical protein [Nocardia altamirensis]
MRSDEPVLGQVRTETVDTMDFLRWNTQIGRILAKYLETLDVPEAEKNAANILFCSPQVIDWAAAMYAAAEREQRPTLPTEVLNADGCRVFGTSTKRGWRGAALAVSCEREVALVVLTGLAIGTGEPRCVLLEAELSAPDNAGATVTLGSFRHD